MPIKPTNSSNNDQKTQVSSSPGEGNGRTGRVFTSSKISIQHMLTNFQTQIIRWLDRAREKINQQAQKNVAEHTVQWKKGEETVQLQKGQDGESEEGTSLRDSVKQLQDGMQDMFQKLENTFLPTFKGAASQLKDAFGSGTSKDGNIEKTEDLKLQGLSGENPELFSSMDEAELEDMLQDAMKELEAMEDPFNEEGEMNDEIFDDLTLALANLKKEESKDQ